MAGYKVEICGVNTATLPLLKPKEKEELLKRLKSGDKEAREQFIQGNLRLVLSIVQRFSQSQENVDDLFQIGCVGMIKAIDNFDINQGVQFSTYAVPVNIVSGKSLKSNKVYFDIISRYYYLVYTLLQHPVLFFACQSAPYIGNFLYPFDFIRIDFSFSGKFLFELTF